MLALDMQKWSSSRWRTFFALLVETLLTILVVMGGTIGPTKRKVDHLHELDRAEDDESVLAQGSSFERSVLV